VTLVPVEDHASRTLVLDTLAVLLGYHVDEARFPDDSIPDVLRVNPIERGLFVGDAKHSESPRCVATALRFRRYLKWVRAHRAAAGAGDALVALCFPDLQDRDAWLRLLESLAEDAGVPGNARVNDLSVGSECHVLLLQYPATSVHDTPG
jgi:hypothetical protein